MVIVYSNCTMKLNPENKTKIRRHIIRKLVKRDAWGNTYINKHLAMKGILRHLLGFVDEILDELWREGIVIYHKRKECISLNTKRKGRIEKIITE